MRTYLIDAESKEEYIVDLIKTTLHSSELVEFEYSTIKDQELVNKKNIYVRKLGGNYFGSFDNKKWTKMARQYLPKHILNIDRMYNVYHGFKPSGLGGESSGELVTQMPGKIVKINVSEGDEVKEGDTVIILEAMKMENEIKSGVAGKVKSIHVKSGQALDQGVLMMEIE